MVLPSLLAGQIPNEIYYCMFSAITAIWKWTSICRLGWYETQPLGHPGPLRFMASSSRSWIARFDSRRAITDSSTVSAAMM